MNLQELERAKAMKERLNKVGSGFCLAKWDQVTMHLHNGMTHSCHHPHQELCQSHLKPSTIRARDASLLQADLNDLAVTSLEELLVKLAAWRHARLLRMLCRAPRSLRSMSTSSGFLPRRTISSYFFLEQSHISQNFASGYPRYVRALNRPKGHRRSRNWRITAGSRFSISF